jgi:glycosyltransferase involved in cell wall biosynthesis
VSGFDLSFEPGYYEDADLCFKITSLGLFIYYCPQSVVHHIENATTSGFRHELEYVKEINCKTFLQRWGDYLSARARCETAELPPVPQPRAQSTYDVRSSGPIAVFHTPYDLISSHRERYLLSAASTLHKSHHVYVATDARYSSYRLDYLARDLSLDLSGISIISRSELYRLPSIDLFVHIGEHPFPLIAATGRRNFYMCQFPFQMTGKTLPDHQENLAGYDCVLVESPFAENQLRCKINAFRFDTDLRILPPPISGSLSSTNGADKNFSRAIILSIEKFSGREHNLRYDIVIEGIKCLIEAGVDAELHLVCPLQLHLREIFNRHSDELQYYHEVRQRTEGLPVHFHMNAVPTVVSDLLSRANIYWHTAGFEIDPLFSPEKCEHSGIAVLEAMASGCIPFVVASGAPVEFVRDKDTGFQYTSLHELVLKTHTIMLNPAGAATISQRAIQEARRFSDEAFIANWRRIATE